MSSKKSLTWNEGEKKKNVVENYFPLSLAANKIYSIRKKKLLCKGSNSRGTNDF